VSRIGRIRHAIGALASLALVIGHAGAARAVEGPGPVTLTWDAPAGCPTGDQVAGQVDRTLAKLAGATPPLRATAHVTGGPGQTWQGRLILDVSGVLTEREFQAESCEAMASAAALIIAVALDEASDQPLPAPAPPPPVVVAQPAPPPAPARRASFFLGVNAVVDYDTLPTPPAVGAELAVGRASAVRAWRLAWIVGATVIPNLRPAVSQMGSVAGEFWLFGLSGRGCLHVAESKVEIGPCLGTELVAMRASDGGANPVAVSTDTRAWFSLLASLSGAYHAAPSLDVTLRADAVMPMARPDFHTLTHANVAYQVPGVAFRGALGLAWRFQ
jgi:hypothetical protein